MLYMGEGGGPPFHFAYSNTSEQIYKWNVEIKRVLHTKRIINKELNKDSGIFFFCDPVGNYEDLEEVRTVRHECQDLSNCDKG